ncbi:MAG: AMP-binding protein [Clostridia bacterium]|nr:AMP-binding protein [Clostridia bacterium]
MKEVRAPWLQSRGDILATLEYFDGTMFDMVKAASERYPHYTAYDFVGNRVGYASFVKKIEKCAKALSALGVKEDDRVTICLPNIPQSLIMFYAINRVGAVANMVHPLSSEKEIEFYLRDSGSTVALTLAQCYPKFAEARKNYHLPNLIITSISDGLMPIVKQGIAAFEAVKNFRVPKQPDVMKWGEFLSLAKYARPDYAVKRDKDAPAVILYSGGTTGTTKGILHSNYGFNVFASQIIATNPMFRPGDKMLAAMPIFHGFGLGVCVHSMLAKGGRCVLVPRFSAESYAELLRKHRPNFIAGVPTLYEALLRLRSLDGTDLSCFKGVFSGGDSLPVELKKKFDRFLAEHNATVSIREGYGATECIAACCLTPIHRFKEGSIGIPFPDTYFKIVSVGGEDEVEYGSEGEICISGPTVMMEYVNQPEETKNTLRLHDDGRVWLHTGDLGMMDEEGFVYFRQRIKRMIISSGYNVYPSQIENVLDSHKYVHMSCVIGVPDPFSVQKPKAFVVLNEGVPANNATKLEIFRYCRGFIAKYAMPREIEFRTELPKTGVGKIAYRVLEAEEAEKRAARSTEVDLSKDAAPSGDKQS